MTTMIKFKTPEQLKKLKPLKCFAMTSLGKAELKDLDPNTLMSGHKYVIIYNKRTRVCSELYDLTLMGIQAFDLNLHNLTSYDFGVGGAIETEEENDAD